MLNSIAEPSSREPDDLLRNSVIGGRNDNFIRKIALTSQSDCNRKAMGNLMNLVVIK